MLNDSCSLQLPLGDLMRVTYLMLLSMDGSLRTVNGVRDKGRRIGEKAGLGRAGMEGREDEGCVLGLLGEPSDSPSTEPQSQVEPLRAETWTSRTGNQHKAGMGEGNMDSLDYL